MDLSFLGPRAQAGDHRERLWMAAAVLLILISSAALYWISGAERRAIAGLEPSHRRAVFEQAYGEFEQLCGAGPRSDALERRCTEQAAYLVEFPDCDSRCIAIVRSHTPRATK